MTGILLINKETNMTSYDVIRVLKRQFKISKIGHTGTLDPFASGLMVVLVGSATKLSQHFLKKNKSYQGEILFGNHYDTYDVTGEIVNSNNINVTISNLESIKSNFLGKIMQTPPIYSAIKVDGKKLYEYARANKEVEIRPREVEIFDLNFNEISLNHFYFETNVSSGTYIRSLAVDLATKLKTYGALKTLNRVSVGNFKLKDSYKLSEVTTNSLISLEDYFVSSPKVYLSNYLSKLVKNGIYLDDRQIVTEEIFLVYNDLGKLIALYEPVSKNSHRPLVIL